MKGCVVMVSCSEQIKTLSQILKEEIEEFDKLSKDEAKKKAQEDLKEIGFLDDQGNVTEPYIALRQECTARNLDLTTRESIGLLKLGYLWLSKVVGEKPKNRNIGSNKDLLLRNLDCAVIQKLHSELAKHPEMGISPFDSVRGMFIEGNEIYPGAGFMEETHTQICVINPNCIKGYFLPRHENKDYPMP